MAKLSRAPRPGGKTAMFDVLRGASPDAGPATPVQPAPTSLPAAASSASPGLPAGVVAAAAAAVALVGLIGLGFVAGRLTAPAAPQAAADDSAPITMPEVLGVPPAGPQRSVTPAAGVALARLEPTDTAAVVPTKPAASAGRTDGLNYVLFQSYHQSESDRAEATVAALRKAGVGATVERGVPGWGRRLAVVGTDGFERITKNAGYAEYLARARAVGKTASRDRRIKSFDPLPIRWGPRPATPSASMTRGSRGACPAFPRDRPEARGRPPRLPAQISRPESAAL